MERPALLSLSLCFLFLFNGCLANVQNYEPRRESRESREGREGFRRYQECQLDRLDALEPTNRIQADGGIIESWDPNHRQMRCAGVAVYRYIIDPKGLFLPQFSNAPRLVFIERGRGFKGVVIPGCPETYQESQQSRPEFQDRHQKVRQVRAGDVFAVPAGAVHWTYNDGSEKLVAVVLVDVSNHANQLDRYPRTFYLAGNPEEEFNQWKTRGRQEHEGRRESSNKNNVLAGIEERILADVLDISQETARKLRGEDDYRRNIVKVEGRMEVIKPPSRRPREEGKEREWDVEEEEERVRELERERRRRGDNGLEETICSMRLKENIADASRADVYDSEAGRLSLACSHRLPILRFLQLSAEHGVLRRHAMHAPHWNTNAHSVIFGLRGSARVQVVDDWGRKVFDGELRQRQVLVVPQNFALVKRAADEGFEWVSFKTNDHAMTNSIAGRTSSLRAFPAQVLANAFRISTDEAFRLKFNRPEMTLLPPRRSSGWRENAVKAM